MYDCMYACMVVCMSVRMYVCVHVRMYVMFVFGCALCDTWTSQMPCASPGCAYMLVWFFISD